MIRGSTWTKYRPKRMELGPSYIQITEQNTLPLGHVLRLGHLLEPIFVYLGTRFGLHLDTLRAPFFEFWDSERCLEKRPKTKPHPDVLGEQATRPPPYLRRHGGHD